VELNKRGYTLGTISHTSPNHLASAGILPLFKTIIHAARFGWRKPHPAPFLAAARQSGVLPDECAYVGDRPSRDVIGAREAGYGMVIQLMLSTEPPEGEPCPMHPDILIHHLGELLEIFPGLEEGTAAQKIGKTEPLLYDAAISSMWWNKETSTINEFLERGRSLGFPRFELNHQTPPEVFARIDLNRYHIGSLHDPCPAIIPAKTLEKADQVITSTNEVLRQRAVDGVKNSIEEAYRLGARHVVIHPGRIAGDHSMDDQLRELYRNGLKGTDEYENLWRQVMADRTDRSAPYMHALIKSLHQIVAFADGKGLTLGLENRYHYYELPVFGELDTLLGEFKQEWVGWQFDIGHLQVLAELGLTLFDPWLERFGERIVGVHLHDVKGIKDHQAPGKGEVDFKMIAAALPPFCFRTLEVDKSLTDLEIAAGLEVLAESGCITKLSGGSDNA
jgi:sugar phosphate isomerase/epimerase